MAVTRGPRPESPADVHRQELPTVSDGHRHFLRLEVDSSSGQTAHALNQWLDNVAVGAADSRDAQIEMQDVSLTSVGQVQLFWLVPRVFPVYATAEDRRTTLRLDLFQFP